MEITLQEIKERFAANQNTCEHLVGVFSLLSNKHRLRILCMLMGGEFCVNDIVDTVSPGKLTNISQQLRMLALAGFIKKRRVEQKQMYSIADDRIRELLTFLEQNYLNKGDDE